MSSAVDIARYRFQPDEQLLLDANVWLYCYVPLRPSGFWERLYSRALADMLNARCTILVDNLVLAEFANRSAHVKYDIARDSNLSLPDTFRKFCESEHFKDVARAVAFEVRAVLRNSRPIDVPFSQFDTARLVSDFETGKRDFNDLMIAELCRRQGLTLVTNDAGFTEPDIPILTANRRLLS